MTVRFDDSFDGIDWDEVKVDLTADRFDNGRNASALRRSFEQSQHVVFARVDEGGDRLVGMARLLSDGLVHGSWPDNDANR